MKTNKRKLYESIMKDVSKTVKKRLNESFEFDRDRFLDNIELYDDNDILKFGCGGYAVFNDQDELMFFGTAKQAYEYIDWHSSPIHKLICKEVDI